MVLGRPSDNRIKVPDEDRRKRKSGSRLARIDSKKVSETARKVNIKIKQLNTD